MLIHDGRYSQVETSGPVKTSIMWGSVQAQGSLESQIGWPQAHTNKRLVTMPFLARNPSMEAKPTLQDISLKSSFQPNGQTKKILLKKPAELTSLDQDFAISSINLGDSPTYELPAEDLFPDLHAFDGGINSDDVIENNVANLDEDFSVFWNVNDSHASAEAALMSTQSSSSQMLMVDPKDVEGLSEEMTQGITNSSEECVQLSYVEGVTANDQFTIDLNSGIDFSSVDFDLLKSVMNEGIGADDPTFQNLVVVNDVESSAVDSIEKLEDLWLSVDSEVRVQEMAASTPQIVATEQPIQVVETIQEVKKGRGRPRIVRPPEPAVPKRRGRPPSTAKFIAPDLSPEDSEEARYRRMRDLNNEASRLCRLNRKRKFETFEQELQYEQERNAELQMKVRLLTEQISKLKDAHINLIVKNST